MKTDLDFLTSLWEVTAKEIGAEGFFHTFARMLEVEHQEEHEKQQLQTIKSTREQQMRSLKNCLVIEKRQYTAALEKFKENATCISFEYEDVLGRFLKQICSTAALSIFTSRTCQQRTEIFRQMGTGPK